MRLSVRPGPTGPSRCDSLESSRAVRRAPDASKGDALLRSSVPVSARSDSGGVRTVNEKRELSPGRRPTASRSFASPPPPGPDAGMSTRFPFGVGGDPDARQAGPIAPFSRFVPALGSVDS